MSEGGDDMKRADITVEILKDIRQELRDTKQGVEGLKLEVRETNARIDTLARRMVESEVRTATAMTELAGDVRELTSFLRTQGDLRPRVERCEREITELQSKLRPAS